MKGCPHCKKPVSMRGGYEANYARVRIAYVGYVHRSCFEANKDKFFALSMAKAAEKGAKHAVMEEQRPADDVTEWMEHDFEEGEDVPWYLRAVRPTYGMWDAE